MSDSGSNFDESDILTNKDGLLGIEKNNKSFMNKDAIIPEILAVFQSNVDDFGTELRNGETKGAAFDDLLGSLDDLNKQIDGLM